MKIDVENDDQRKKAIDSEIAKIKGSENRSCAYFIGIDTLESYLSPEILKPMTSGFGQSMKLSGDTLLIVAKQSSGFRNQLAEYCDIHLKLAEVDRTLVLYSLTPASELFHVNFDYSVGYPGIKLVPIL